MLTSHDMRTAQWIANAEPCGSLIPPRLDLAQRLEIVKCVDPPECGIQHQLERQHELRVLAGKELAVVGARGLDVGNARAKVRGHRRIICRRRDLGEAKRPVQACVEPRNGLMRQSGEQMAHVLCAFAAVALLQHYQRKQIAHSLLCETEFGSGVDCGTWGLEVRLIRVVGAEATAGTQALFCGVGHVVLDDRRSPRPEWEHVGEAVMPRPLHVIYPWHARKQERAGQDRADDLLPRIRDDVFDLGGAGQLTERGGCTPSRVVTHPVDERRPVLVGAPADRGCHELINLLAGHRRVGAKPHADVPEHFLSRLLELLESQRLGRSCVGEKLPFARTNFPPRSESAASALTAVGRAGPYSDWPAGVTHEALVSRTRWRRATVEALVVGECGGHGGLEDGASALMTHFRQILDVAENASEQLDPEELVAAVHHALRCEACAADRELGRMIPHELARLHFALYADALGNTSDVPPGAAVARTHMLTCDECTSAFGLVLAERAAPIAPFSTERLEDVIERVAAELRGGSPAGDRRGIHERSEQREPRSKLDKKPSPTDYQHIALLASSTLRRGPMSSLARLVRELTPYLSAHTPDLYLVAGSYRMLLRCGLLRGYPIERLHCVAAGRLAGLIDLGASVLDRSVAGLDGIFGADAVKIATQLDADWMLDCVVYLVDPSDPPSVMPETMALKRECSVMQRPFLDTYTSAIEFFGLLAATAGGKSHGNALPDDLRRQLGYDRFPHQVLAMAAHDANKQAMLEFARANIPFMQRFAQRLGTATTASLLNGDPPLRIDDLAVLRASLELRWELDRAGVQMPWVGELATGREGGNLQIAESIAMGVSDSVLLLEEPRPQSEYGATHQLVERAARAASHPDRLAASGRQMLLHDTKSASIWAQLWDRAPEGGPVTLETVFRERYAVELVLAPPSSRQWEAVVDEAAWYLLAAIATKRAPGEGSAPRKRVTVSCGAAIRDVVGRIHEVSLALTERIHAHTDRQEQAVRACKLEFPQHVARIEQIAQRRRLTLAAAPDNAKLWSIGPVTVAPIVGRFGSADESVEATMIARGLAKQLAAKTHGLDRGAFTIAPSSVPQKLARHWDQTDIVVLTCGGLKPAWFASGKPVPLFPGMYEQLLDAGAVGELAGLYLDAEGAEVIPDEYRRNGMTLKHLRLVAAAGAARAAIMVAGIGPTDGPTPSRVTTVLGALRGGLASVLVTDAAFAAAVLRADDGRPAIDSHPARPVGVGN
jgi:methylglyoxal synthase